MTRARHAAAPFALILLFGATSLAMAAGMHKQSSMNGPLTDQKFVTQAGEAGQAEVQLAQLALQKSQDPDTRSFAQRMIKDHQQANEKLKSIADQHNWTVPQSLDQKHQQAMQQLRNESGDAFNAAYAKQMDKDHQKVIALFKNAANSQNLNPDLKSFASDTLSTLKTHEQLASTLRSEETREAKANTQRSPASSNR